MLASWVVFPVALAVLCLGLGLLVEWCTGRRLPGPLLIPAGLAIVLALVGPLQSFELGAAVALPVFLVLGAAGFALGATRLRGTRPGWWAAAAAVAVFATFAAPSALTGNQTFSGSLVLPDTSNQLQLAERLGSSGREFESLPSSSYKVSLTKYLNSQYPVAAQGALGVLRPLGFTDLIWLYQPFLAFMMAMAALSLYQLLAVWSGRPAISAAGAFLSAQPALTYSYVLQGSIKEIAAVSLICTLVALVADAVQERSGARTFIPIGAVAVAMLGALGPAAAAYLIVPVLVLGIPWALRVSRGRSWREVGWAAGLLVLVTLTLLPFLSGASTAYNVGTAVLAKAEDLGNLARPLELRQGVGVWLAGDFRYGVDYALGTTVLSVVAAVAAVAGTIVAVRQRALGPLLFIGTLVPVSLYLLQRGSPYADGKVLALASPAVVLAAVVAVIAVTRHPRLRAVGVVAGVAVAAGVLGSNVLAYHGVQNAPGGRYAELLEIDDRFAGQGPSLLTEYDEFAGYLLRKTQVQSEPESALGYQGPPARRPNGLTDQRHRPSVKSALDIDDLDPSYVQRQRLLVIRHSPAVSRPPANYRRIFSGRYYDVWQRDRRRLRAVAHLPLGTDRLSPSAVPPCGRVRALARRARRAGGTLAFVQRPGIEYTDPMAGAIPSGWFQFGAYPRSLVTAGPGEVKRPVRLFAGGAYRVWIGGSFARAVHVSVDGKPVGSVAYESGNPGQYFPVGRVRLRPGRHVVELSRAGGDLRPGDGGGVNDSLVFVTPTVLSPEPNERAGVRTIAPDRARELCGRRLDWIEVLATRR